MQIECAQPGQRVIGICNKVTLTAASVATGSGLAEAAEPVHTALTQTPPDVFVLGLTWSQFGILAGVIVGLGSWATSTSVTWWFQHLRHREEAARRREEAELHELDMQIRRRQLQEMEVTNGNG